MADWRARALCKGAATTQSSHVFVGRKCRPGVASVPALLGQTGHSVWPGPATNAEPGGLGPERGGVLFTVT